jgi:nitrogen fixation/metabolism regulation signal transduction histidine kinase
MSRNRFWQTFRARLMLLLTSFLLLTLVLVFAMDKWVQRRADAEVALQSSQIKDAVNSGYGDFLEAFGMAIESLKSERFLYDLIESKHFKLPKSVEHIIVTNRNGLVTDSTLRELQGQTIHVPEEEVTQAEPGDPVEGEVQIHGGSSKTYDFPVATAKGTYWIVIVTREQAITNKIENASQKLASKSRELSNIRLASTTSLLIIALAFAVVIGWRFTRPIKELATAARRVAEGSLDFHVDVNRTDEVGQLASTFNEMIAGLKSKRQLEEKLNQAERSAVIGRLTQAVAHEIRNPLNVINLSIDHVGSKYAPEDETRRKQFKRILSSIKDEVVRLKRLVNDLLNYGRPAQLSVGDVDMSKLVDETMALVRTQADEQHVDVTVTFADGPSLVRGDAERLKSCISNLAINALQAMANGGRLNASVGRSDGIVEVVISDTGVGISGDSLSKIFEPYFSTKQSGFGLGLAVTKKIVDDHGGSIEVASEIDRGTTFTVRLPSVDSPSGSSEP